MASAQVQITQLPSAGTITGSEAVPIVQNGVTVQTTTGAIAASPTQTQTFLTKNLEPTLPNSRYFSTDGNFSLTDNGAQSYYRLNLTGIVNYLNTISTGMVVKDGSGTLVARTLSTSGGGISVTNGDGVSGNPTFQLTGVASAIADIGAATGLISIQNGTTATAVNILGTTNQISVTNGNGTGNPTIAIASNPALPGSAGVVLPSGTTGDRSVSPTNGTLRYNTTIALLEAYLNGAWTTLASGSGVTSILTGTGLTGGPITSTGTISIANTAVTAGSYGGATKTLTATVNAQGQLTAMAETPIAITNTQVSGLGTMSTQDANAVAITGGTVSGATVSSATITGSTVNSTSVGATTPSTGAFTSVAMTSGTITTAPTTGNDIVNKTYADAIASGINFHQACRLATTTALAANTYNNGSSGVGATLTANANGALSVDGVAVATSNRILVKNEVTQANNGVYTVTQTGSAGAPYILTRATDFDSAGTGVDQIDAGDFFLITAGSTLANTSWVQQTPLPITVGTTAIVFQQFGAPLTYSAGTGLNESPAYTFNIANTAVTSGSYGSASSVPTYSVNAQGQLTLASNTAIAINANQITSGTLPVANGGTGRTVGNYSVYANEVHVSNLSGNDTTGDGTLINPVATITKALTLLTATSRTVIVHPGVYAESPTVSSTNTTITTLELTGANTELTGTLTLSAAARVSGLKMANLTITGSGSAYISNCTVDTRVIKSGSNYVEIINSELQCTLGVQISGAGTVSIVGNKCWAVAVSNASANVLIKDCFQVLAPSVTAGTLQFDGCAIFAASPASNAVTSSAGTFITLANSFVLNSAGNNVERVSLAGSYSIVNLVYDKTNSTFAGTNLNAIDYFSVINAQTVIATTGIFGGTF
jgi:hypothetical protein